MDTFQFQLKSGKRNGILREGFCAHLERNSTNTYRSEVFLKKGVCGKNETFCTQ
jgi:hypothetical protein